MPAIRILRLIPGVKVVELDQGCCGLSGSYGFKKEKYNIAMQIGQALFNRASEGIRTGDFENIACESVSYTHLGCEKAWQHRSLPYRQRKFAASVLQRYRKKSLSTFT